jgi:hypothetical protein
LSVGRRYINLRFSVRGRYGWVPMSSEYVTDSNILLI